MLFVCLLSQWGAEHLDFPALWAIHALVTIPSVTTECASAIITSSKEKLNVVCIVRVQQGNWLQLCWVSLPRVYICGCVTRMWIIMRSV